MRLNNLSPAPGSKTEKRRLGRGIGSGFGKTSGKGHKGMKARAGGGVPAGFEGGQQPLQRRLPKFGFNSAMARNVVEIRLHELELVDADVVDLEALKRADIIRHDIKRARVILSGAIEKAVTVKGLKVTKGAREAILAAGGKVED